MLKCFLVLILASLAACQTATTYPPESTPAIPTSRAETTATPESTLATQRGVFHVNQMQVEMDTPVGWQVHQMDSEGVMIAERLGSMGNDSMLEGIRFHLFLPPMDEFTVPDSRHANVALSILDQAMGMPRYLGDSEASEPVGFSWGGYEAAYYLVASPSGSRTIVLAVMTPPDASRLLVCNISAPMGEVPRIRPITLLLLGNLTVNGVAMGDALVENLADPLVFPTPEATPQIMIK